MNQYSEALNAYFADNGDTCGHPEIASMLDVFYYRFCIQEGLDSEKIRTLFWELGDILRPLPQQDRDRISDVACDLCENYQKETFRQGLMIGFRLFTKLNTNAE